MTVQWFVFSPSFENDVKKVKAYCKKKKKKKN